MLSALVFVLYSNTNVGSNSNMSQYSKQNKEPSKKLNIHTHIHTYTQGHTHTHTHTHTKGLTHTHTLLCSHNALHKLMRKKHTQEQFQSEGRKRSERHTVTVLAGCMNLQKSDCILTTKDATTLPHPHLK